MPLYAWKVTAHHQRCCSPKSFSHHSFLMTSMTEVLGRIGSEPSPLDEKQPEHGCSMEASLLVWYRSHGSIPFFFFLWTISFTHFSTSWKGASSDKTSLHHSYSVQFLHFWTVTDGFPGEKWLLCSSSWHKDNVQKALPHSECSCIHTNQLPLLSNTWLLVAGFLSWILTKKQSRLLLDALGHPEALFTAVKPPFEVLDNVVNDYFRCNIFSSNFLAFEAILMWGNDDCTPIFGCYQLR